MSGGAYEHRVSLGAALVGVAAAASLTGAAIAQDDVQSTAVEETVYLEADEVVENESTGSYMARGNVEARYADRVLRADEIEFRPQDARVIARGNVVIVDEEGLVTFAEEAELSDDLSQGVIAEFAARLPQDGKIGARVAARNAEDDFTLVRAFYTACEPCAQDGLASRPTWRIRARRVVRDASAEQIYYRDAVFEVKGVPIAYSPFFSHTDPSVGRKSGFLLPNFGDSSRTGTFYQQPYYWAFAPSQDVTVAPRVMSDANPLLAMEYRKRFFSGNVRIEGSATSESELNLLDDDQLASLPDAEVAELQAEGEEFRGHVFAEGSFRINENWTWGFGAARTTGDFYLDRYEIQDIATRRGLYRAASRRLLSQVFSVRQTPDSYASVAAFDAQDLRSLSDEAEAQLPTVAPFAEARKTFNAKFLGGRMEARGNLAVLNRESGIDYRRLSVETHWRRRFVTNQGVVISPFALARGDVYAFGGEDIDNVSGRGAGAEVDETVSRAVGNAGVDVSFPVGRRAGPLDIVLEPLVNVTVAPTGVNDETIVDFNVDSTSVDLDEASLFNANRSTGFDLFEEGSHASLGARATVEWGDYNSASMFLGQSYRTNDEEAFTAASGLDGKTSDIVGAAGFQLGRRTRVDSNFRVDHSGFDIQRLNVVGRTGLGPIDVGMRYLQFDETQAAASNRPSKEANVDIGVRLTRNWRTFYRFNRDLDLDETRREFIGLVYDDNCTRVEVIYKNENFDENVLGAGDSLTVRFTLSTLGSFESN